MISIAHVLKTFGLFVVATMVAAVPQTIEGKVAALDFKVDMLLEGMAKHVKADNVKAKFETGFAGADHWEREFACAMYGQC